MNTVIITGGCGFLGEAVSYTLLENGFRVIAVDKKTSYSKTNSYMHEYYERNLRNPLYQEFNYDISDPKEVNDFIHDLRRSSNGEGYQILIHMAAYKDIEESYDNREGYYLNNINSSIGAVRIAKELGIKGIIYSSSAAVYNDANKTGASLKETDINMSDLMNNSPYGKSKLLCELLIEDICIHNRISSYCLRYQNPCGTLNEMIHCPVGDGSLFGNIIKCIKENKRFEIYYDKFNTEDGTAIRDLIDLRDFVEFHLYLVNEILDETSDKHLITNFGTGKPVTILQVCKAVKELYPNFNYTIGGYRKGDTAGSVADMSTFYKRFKFRCKYDYKDTILYTIKLLNQIS